MPIEMQRRKEQDRSISGLFEMRRRLPSAALDGVVTDIFGYRETAPGYFHNIEYASLTVPLVISFAEPFAIGLGRTPGDNDRFASFAAGLYAGPVMIQSFGGACCVQVNFTPLGARRFFGRPMSELADRMVALDDVLGLEGIALREKLGNAPDWNMRFDLAEMFVAGRLAAAHETRAEIAGLMTGSSFRAAARASPLLRKSWAGAASILPRDSPTPPASVRKPCRASCASTEPSACPGNRRAGGPTSPPIAAMLTRRIWPASSATWPAKRRRHCRWGCSSEQAAAHWPAGNISSRRRNGLRTEWVIDQSG